MHSPLVPHQASSCAVLFLQLGARSESTLKNDTKIVDLPNGPEDIFNRDTSRDEHVIALEDFLPVQMDGGERIQPFKDEVDVVSDRDGCGRLEGTSILPVYLTGPLGLSLVLANVRIRDDLLLKQLHLNYRRKCRDGCPFFQAR